MTVPPLEIIAHRILWSVPMLVGYLLLRDGPGFWRRLKLPAGKLAVLAVSGLLVAINWLIFVWAVSDGQILATSLGYFINPLLLVLLGFVVLGERLNRWQTFAVLLAAAGTVYLAWYLAVAPWISLSLALSFALYALVRKRLGVGPMVGMLWETLLLAIPALAYIGWQAGRGNLVFAHGSVWVDILLMLAGLVTVLPLVWYNVAAKNMTFGLLGLMQYLAPSITFLLAVWIYGEPFTPGHAVAFACIWSALLLITGESLTRGRSWRRL